MRRLILLVGLGVLVMPLVVQAQQQTCEQRAAIMGQLIEDMTRQRGAMSTAEVEAASLKVQVKMLQAEAEKVKQEAVKKPEAAPEHGSH